MEIAFGPHWFAGCGMLGRRRILGRLLDESCIARESQNSPSPVRASDRLLSIGSYEVLTSDRHAPGVGGRMP